MRKWFLNAESTLQIVRESGLPALGVVLLLAGVLQMAAGLLRLDPATHRVTANGKAIPLGPTEFRLLRFLLARPERVHSRTQLLDQVWGDHVYIEERTVDVHIRRLRLALEPFGQDGLVETVRGSGYRLAVPR